jgi:hypothetical protein
MKVVTWREWVMARLGFPLVGFGLREWVMDLESKLVLRDRERQYLRACNST